MKDHQKKLKIAIIGMGYVGLPLAIAFSKKRQVIGFDTNKKRINDLKLGHDSTCEVSKKKLLRFFVLHYKIINLIFLTSKMLSRLLNC